MIVIIGASASGKTEISKRLVSKYGYKKLITTTTRKMRINEINGVDYHFVTNEEFERLIDEEMFVEYTKYGDFFYGINKKDIYPNSVVVVEINGANKLIDNLDEELFIVYIETTKNIREERMIKRGDKLNDVLKRLSEDERVFLSDKVKRINLEVKNDLEDIDIIVDKINNQYNAKGK